MMKDKNTSIRKITYKEYLRGIELYNNFNSSTDRTRLESSANELISITPHQYDTFIRFMRDDFLRWMQSRIPKDDFNATVSSEEFRSIYDTLATAHYDYESILEELSNLNYIGPVYASAIISIMSNKKYGIINTYVRTALVSYGCIESGMAKNNIRSVVFCQEKLCEVANHLNSCGNHDNEITPRDVDKSLWGIGKEILSKRDSLNFSSRGIGLF